MKTNHFIIALSILIIFFVGVASCDSKRDKIGGDKTNTSVTQKVPVTYNIYVENSGSMAGYCNMSNQAALETVVDDYYRVLNSQNDSSDVTLNFINTSIERSSYDITRFRNSIKGKCTAQYTKIDDMLNMMMDSVRNNCVNFLFSDYVFTTNNGNLQTAANAITEMFTKQLKNKDLAVAIYKYMVDFNGKYYPGGIRCSKPLPLYVWVFGSRKNVRDVTRMPFNTQNCGMYFLQKASNVDFCLEAKSARMISSDKKTIFVSKWNEERHQDYYEIKLSANLHDILLTEDALTTTSAYKLKSSNSTVYEIFNIEKKDADNYVFRIRTVNSKPAPGILQICYPVTTPSWVDASNFNGTGIPSDSTTYGISYLINGVTKAFKDVSNNNYNYFDVKLNLE